MSESTDKFRRSREAFDALPDNATFHEWPAGHGRNIRPRNDRIMVELERPWSEYDGPLVLPDEIDPDKHDIRIARVLAKGPGDYGEKGLARERVRIPLDVGQRVLVDQLPTHGWWPTVAPGVLMIPWREVLGIFEETSQ